MAKKQSKFRIVHLTSVHSYRDPRIFLKECKSAASHGFQTHLVAPDVDKEREDGVTLHRTFHTESKLLRSTFVVILTFVKALRLNADIFHFHDPELLGVGFLLSWMGYQVIYDVHEDYVTSIRQKKYIPALLRNQVAKLYAWTERRFEKSNTTVLAEKYYKERLPEGEAILNYPPTEIISKEVALENQNNDGTYKLLYTGNILEDRGAYIHASLVTLREDIEVYMIGKCPLSLADKMYKAAGSGDDRLHIQGIGYHVPFEVIKRAYRQSDWLAGLALFPETPHYKRKELTKFFEYMGAGLPIIYSRFPEWQELIDRWEAGVAVDPEDESEIRQVIDWLIANPGERTRMSKNGREAVRREYNWQSQAEKLVAIYHRLCEEG